MVLTRSQSRKKKAVFAFFELPPELRSNVYQLLLGGQLIHIGMAAAIRDDHEHRFCAFTCQAKISDELCYKKAGPSREDRNGMGIDARHGDCTQHVADVLPLDILRVSKQFHQEAALVPFGTNRFTFSDLNDAKGFLRHLTKPRQNAITDVTAHQAQLHYRAWSYRLPIKPKPILLPGLKHLTVFVYLVPGNFLEIFGEPVMSVEGQDELVHNMRMIRSPKLETVDVLINNSRIPPIELQLHEVRDLNEDEIEVWAKRTKDAILAAQH